MIQFRSVSRPTVRAAAFEEARRNSRRVSRLKVLIVLGSAGALAALVFVAFFNPLDNIPKSLSMGGATVNGGKITIKHPRLVGYRKDGRPYQLLAASGVQDIRTPSIVRLNDIEASLAMPDKSVLHLAAPVGVYDSSRDDMRLRRDIVVTNSVGYTARMKSADVNFKAGTIVTRDPVDVVTATTEINAGALQISDDGATVIFSDHVRSVIKSAAAAGQSEQSAAATSRAAP